MKMAEVTEALKITEGVVGKSPEYDLKEFPTCRMVRTTKGYIKETREQGGRRPTRRSPAFR